MKAFVTGGGGFLGTRIVELLRERGDEVVSYSRSPHPHLEALGVRCVAGDLADARALREAMKGSDTVFHTAAKAGVWGRAAEFERTNVQGTLHVIASALENRVRRLVYTSSPSVCFDGKDHVDASNDLPYSKRFLCDYPKSKARAEAYVLNSNGKSVLTTCALRPHLIFGPGDPHLLPRLVARAREGRLAIVGKGTNRVSLTYVDNAAHAHLDAADRLTPKSAHAGQAYFVAQEEPVVLWDWIGDVLRGVGAPAAKRRVPLPIAYAAGAAAELTWRATRRAGEPPMTRFVALQLARTHTYDLSPARHDFGYDERVGLDEATGRTIEWLRRASASPELRRSQSPVS